MADYDDKVWCSATWEGSRRTQLRWSLKLTPMQRLEALQDLAEVSQWLLDARKRHRDTAPDSDGIANR